MDPRIPLGPSYPDVETRRRPMRKHYHSCAGRVTDMRDVFVEGGFVGEVIEVERRGQTGWLPVGVADLDTIEPQSLAEAAAMLPRVRATRRPKMAKRGLNVEVPPKGVYSRRTAKHVIVEGVVTAGPKGSLSREVSVYIPHHVIEMMATLSPASVIIDVEEEECSQCTEPLSKHCQLHDPPCCPSDPNDPCAAVPDPDEQQVELVSADAVVTSEAAAAVLAKPLGARQLFVLKNLVTHGHWFPRCGWQYNTPGTTVEILNTLSSKGLAMCVHVAEQRYEPTEVAFEVERQLNPRVESEVAPSDTDMARGFELLKAGLEAQIVAAEAAGHSRLAKSARAMIDRLDELFNKEV